MACIGVGGVMLGVSLMALMSLLFVFLKDSACGFSCRNTLSALQMLRNSPLSMLKG
jgi:hypothetical protein